MSPLLLGLIAELAYVWSPSWPEMTPLPCSLPMLFRPNSQGFPQVAQPPLTLATISKSSSMTPTGTPQRCKCPQTCLCSSRHLNHPFSLPYLANSCTSLKSPSGIPSLARQN